MNINFKDKNLLIISHSYSNFVKDQVEALSKYFNHIYVLVRHNPIADISEYVPINYLKPFRASSKIDINNKPDNISTITTNILYFPTSNQYKKLGEKHFKVVDKVIREKNISFDLIHAHFTWSAGYAGAKLKEKYRVPFIVTGHGHDIYDLPFKDSEWKQKIEYVLNTADNIITVSNNNLKCITKLNVTTPVKVLPNGFRSNLFYPMEAVSCRQTLGISPGQRMILAVGNLFPIKGHQYLIKAIKEIIKHRKDVMCYIVGSGILKNKLQIQIEKLKLNDYIKITGRKPHNEIPIWINACDVFVMPSLGEGNPTVMFECLACGKPFIGTRVGGIPEIITSEEYGLLCEPTNSNRLAEKILIALDKQWGSTKIKIYAGQFAWENIAREIFKVYKNSFSYLS
ncbi:MAG: glycosyltransferase [Actinobacteria bacterium]|nr:glycosyltransferase [Actinomycetota bacterium]